ncbi:MAG: hypothetical protein ACJA1H_000956 [Glaciecola sp.]|jgi:hypothetical protein
MILNNLKSDFEILKSSENVLVSSNFSEKTLFLALVLTFKKTNMTYHKFNCVKVKDTYQLVTRLLIDLKFLHPKRKKQ